MTPFTKPFSGVKALADETDKTQILVLGTPHLRFIEERFHPDLLDTLIACLERFEPHVIAVKSMSPFLIAVMEHQGGFYTDILGMFAAERLKLGHHAQQILSLSRAEAEQQAKVLSEASNLNDGERVRLILHLLAAYDLYAALLQWSALPLEARANELPLEMAQELERQVNLPDERNSLALKLARKLGHQTLAYIDDHQDAAIYFGIAERLEPELEASNFEEFVSQDPGSKASDRAFDIAVAQGDLLSYYRYANTPDFSRQSVDRECGIYLRTKLASGLDRARLAQWEVRNLNMAARIRQESALIPGGRLLAIAGYSHKPLLELYLSQLVDVELIAFEQLCAA